MNVLVFEQIKAAGPWELPYQSEIITKCLPCPPCKFPVPVQCLGKHETADLPCYEARPYNCGRSCGRKLNCGNHTCTLQCHTVVSASGNLLVRVIFGVFDNMSMQFAQYYDSSKDENQVHSSHC